MVRSRYPELAISVREDDQHVYALCPAFGLISEADTLDRAISNLDDLRDRAAALYQRAGCDLPYSLTKEELKEEIGHSFHARAIKILSQVAKGVLGGLNQIVVHVRSFSMRKCLIGAYLVGALLTLGFQINVREPICTARGDCGLSFTKGVVWSIIWPVSWVVYIAGMGGLSFI